MDAARWKQIDELVDAALEVPVGQRRSFVTKCSGTDIDLRKAVLDLLDAQDKPDSTFLDQSAMRVAAKTIAEEKTEVAAFAFIGKTIYTYHVEKLLGLGGMGEVYLAFDEKLKRKLALKLLPPEYGSDDERVKRFELEARAISSLNHPGIVTIYDVGNFEGINYIATEYVEGKTLRELMGGEFKMRNIILNCIQICDALAAAHYAGIIHRDIKPENIMIRPDGYAKILDFGLAKLTDPGHQTMRDLAATSEGVIIGTPGYMSPAQIADDTIDHRTDLWSCGVVLYEFLTGKNPFKGSNRQETFQAILTKQVPPCSSLNPEVPPELDAILAKLMEKDPDKNYQSAVDLRADLKQVKRDMDSSPSWSGSSSLFMPRALRGSNWTVFMIPVAALLIIAAGITYYFVNRSRWTAPDWSRASRAQLTDTAGTEFFPSLSPDGKSYVYVAKVDGDWDILLQRVGGRKPQNLTPESNATDTQPSYSPDGEFIAFRSDREPRGIYIMGATGENVKRVADFGYHPAWSPNGKEVAISTRGNDLPDVRNSVPSEIWVINIDTGERRMLTNADAMQPAWSPDGKYIACWFMPTASGRSDVGIMPAAGGEPIVVTNDGSSNWNPVWAPDGKYLYYASDRTGSMSFWRVAVGADGRPTSEPESVFTPSKFSRHLAFSRDGKRFIYVATDNRSNLQAVKVEKDTLKPIGDPFWITTGDRQVSRPDLSPDGSRFVIRMPRRTQDDIVTLDSRGGDLRDITNDAAFDRYPRWSPDGKQIMFTSDRSGNYEIYFVNADGTGLRQITYAQGESSLPVWSPDGHTIQYRSSGKNYLLDSSVPWMDQTPTLLPEYDDKDSRFVAWDWSPDGDKLSGTFSGSPMRAGYYSLSERRFYPLTEATYYPMWLPDSRRLVFANRGMLYGIYIPTRKISEIVKIPQGEMGGLGVSKDGSLIYYVVVEEESDIWMLDVAAEK